MSYCCEECFADEYLKEYIRSGGKKGDCEFCNAKGVMCIDSSELRDLFNPVIDLYTPVEDFMPMECLKNYDGDFIWKKLNDDWQIFNNSEDAENLIRDMFSSSYDYKEGEPLFLTSYVEREDEFWGADREHADILIAQWSDFRHELIYENRFFPRRDINLNVLKSIFPVLVENLSVGTILYRCRITTANRPFSCLQMGAPPTDASKAGRANPVGIRYLYTASDIVTAIAEVRAQTGQMVTIANSRVASPLEVVDLRHPHITSPFKYNYELGNIVLHLVLNCISSQ